MCLYKQDFEYAWGPKYAKSSEYGRVLNMLALHSVLNMPEYALTELCMYLTFKICRDSEYGRVLNMQELHRVLNISQYG